MFVRHAFFHTHARITRTHEMALPSDIEWANKYYDEPEVVRYAGLIHLLSRARRTLQDSREGASKVCRLGGGAVRFQKV